MIDHSLGAQHMTDEDRKAARPYSLVATGIALAVFAGAVIGFYSGYSSGDANARKEEQAKSKIAITQVCETITKDLESKARNYFYVAAKEVKFNSENIIYPGVSDYPNFVAAVNSSSNNYAKNTMLFGQAYSSYAEKMQRAFLVKEDLK